MSNVVAPQSIDGAVERLVNTGVDLVALADLVDDMHESREEDRGDFIEPILAVLLRGARRRDAD